MNRKPPDEEKRREVRELFGITKDNWKCKLPPTNFVKSLVKITSLLPDQQNNPFAQFAHYANDPQYNLDTPNVSVAGMQNPAGSVPDNFVEQFIKSYYLLPNQDQNPFAGHEHDFPNVKFAGVQNSAGPSQGVGDNSVSRRNDKASYVSKHSSGVEIDISSSHSKSKSDGISDTLCKDGVLNEREMIVGNSGMSKNSQVMNKIGSGEKGTNVEAMKFCNVNQDLSSITRILMDESDDPDMLRLLDKDINLDIADDLGSILDLDRGNIEIEKLNTREITKVDLVDKKKKKAVEIIRSTSEGSLGVSESQKFVNQNVTCFKDARSKDTKLNQQNVPQDQSKIGGLTSTRSGSENVGSVLSGNFVFNSGRSNQLVDSAKGKKPQVKNSKKMSKKNVGEKHKPLSVEDEAYNGMRLGDDDPMVQGNTLTQKALGTSRRASTKEDKESLTNSCVRLRYTREQLLQLGKTAFVPEPIKKAIQEIGAEIHEKHLISAAFKIADSCILKSRRRGSSSEAKKEKKKIKKRKKRAELNRKDGVKRLKLQTIVKPKVVQHCRHYLQGRCHEGEQCKFSHDVVPLTKSKPCCHFARQSCMKGDDCPFDHQLSKYPCTTYVDTGFCNRGESCLFSHKVKVKESSEPSVMTLKSNPISVDELDTLKSKQQVDASTPFTFGTTPNNVNKTLATQTSQPAQRPKGLSLISFGKSQLKGSVQPKGLDFSQQQSFSARTDVQSNMVVNENPNLRKTSMNILGSSTQQSIGPEMFTGFWSPTPSPGRSPSFSTQTPCPDRSLLVAEVFTGLPILTSSPHKALKVSEILTDAPPTPLKQKGINVSSSDVPSCDISGEKPASAFSFKADNIIQTCFWDKGTMNVSKEVQPDPRLLGSQTSSSQFSSKVDLPVKNPPNNFQSDYCAGAPTKNRSFNFSEVFKSIPSVTPSRDKSLNVSGMFTSALSPADGPLYDKAGGIASSVFSTKRDIDTSKKSKELQPELGFLGFQTSLSRFSTNVGLPLKNPPSSSQKALQSALAFAAKYQSKTKTSSKADTKGNNLNEVISCSGSKQSEPLQASNILQYLNQDNKEKR